MVQCAAITKKGTQCTRTSKLQTSHCWQHQPAADVPDQRPQNSTPTPRRPAADVPDQRPQNSRPRPRSDARIPTANVNLEGASPPERLTNAEWTKILKTATMRNLSIKGTSSQVRNRVTESLKRGRIPYIDIIGESRKITSRIVLEYGQDVNGLVMGEGELRIERQTYDPDPKLMPMARVKLDVPITVDRNIDFSNYCLPLYRQDPITQEDLSEISDLKMIYADSKKRCYYIPSILLMWESSFTLYDSNSNRVMPSYPKDIHGGLMEPSSILGIYNTAKDRAIDLSPYPLLREFLSSELLVYDVYRFINQYEELVTCYDRLARSHPEDQGLWNRRDLLAYDLLRQLYHRHHISFNGCRKYTNIKSGPGRNGTQIFYQAILTAFFVSENYGLTFDVDDKGEPQEVKWVYGRKNHNIYAKPSYRINSQGDRYLDDYNNIDLSRHFVINSLPLL
jgi:hypothetical protein